MLVDEALYLLDAALKPAHLSDTQELVFRHVWDQKTYEEIAQTSGYDTDYIKHIGSQLWKSLSHALDQKVTKSNIRSVLRQVNQRPALSASTNQYQDWGDAPDVSTFYGRTEELATLNHWVVNDRCRLITVFGMGGIGKTTLSVKLAQQIVVSSAQSEQNAFRYLIWRSLRNAPPLVDLLADLIYALSNQQATDLPEGVHARILLLLDHLQNSCCLLTLDNLETILSSTKQTGHYREGYEAYEQLFDSIGKTAHQSCLILTSREKPQGLGVQEGKTLPVRSFRLVGLTQNEGRSILEAKGLSVTLKDYQVLVDHYAGNPLALKIVATTIQELFNGNITHFLQQGCFIFGDISALLTQQFDRLSPLEQQVMNWLAINREWISLSKLAQDIVPPVLPRSLLAALESLNCRSLIEKKVSLPCLQGVSCFTLQPVVMEFITERLIDQILQEICAGKNANLNEYALIKAQSEDYLREAQTYLILEPVATQLLQHFGCREKIKQCLAQILANLHSQQTLTKPSNLSKLTSIPVAGYTAGNILNLMWYLGINPRGYNFSNLPIRQAFLQGISLHDVNFSDSDLATSLFTDLFGEVGSVAIAPDGSLLAMSSHGNILLWNIETMQHQLTFTGHQRLVRCIAFTPQSIHAEVALLSSGSSDRTVKLWNAMNGQCLKTLKGHTGPIHAVAFSADGRTIASGSGDQTIRLWDIKTGQCFSVLKGHTSHVLSLIFMPHEDILISGSVDCSIRFWDISTGTCLRTLQIETEFGWMLRIALSPDGQTLAVAYDGKIIEFWNLDTEECSKTLLPFGKGDVIRAIAYAPTPNEFSRQMLATGGRSKSVKIVDSYTGENIQTLLDDSDSTWQIHFTPDGSKLIRVSESQNVRVWNTITGQRLRTLRSDANGITSAAFSPDGRFLASSSIDQQVQIWNIATGTIEKTLSGHFAPISTVVFAPIDKGKILLSGSDDRTIKLWNWQTGECLRTLWGHSDDVVSLSLYLKTQLLVSSSGDQTIKLWDWQTGECLQTLEGHLRRIRSVVFSPNGAMLASCSDDRTVKLWEVDTGVCLQTLQGHDYQVMKVIFSPDGQIVASCGLDQTIRLWDVQTGSCLQTLSDKYPIRSIAFSPNGQFLASGSTNGLIKIWNVGSWTFSKTLRGHQREVTALTFHPNSQDLASGSSDETIKLWNFKMGECLRTLRTTLRYEGMNISRTKGLTTAQRATMKALGAIEID